MTFAGDATHPKQKRYVHFVWGWGLGESPRLFCVCSSVKLTALYEFQAQEMMRIEGHAKYWTRVEKVLLNHSWASQYRINLREMRK